MDIEFRPSIGDHEKNIKAGLEYFFNSISDDEFTGSIDKYVITEDQNYEFVVSQIDPTATVSNNDSVVGIAKTVYNQQTKKSSIIIKSHQIVPIIDGLNSGIEINNWTIEQLNALYTSLHEFGHAKDYIKRPAFKSYSLSRPFSLKNVSNYYSEIITDEIGANFCAKEIVPERFKKMGRGNLINHVKTAYKELMDFVASREPIFNEKECFNLIGYISIVILKLQEVFIYRIVENEPLVQSFEIKVLYEITDWLRKLELSYPNWGNLESQYERIMRVIIESLSLKWTKAINSESIIKMHNSS
jgi:hypothetical protein